MDVRQWPKRTRGNKESVLVDKDACWVVEQLQGTRAGPVVHDVAVKVGRPAENRLRAVAPYRGIEAAVVERPHIMDAAVEFNAVIGVIEHVVAVDVDGA